MSSTDISPQARVQRLNAPVALPGHCAMCRSARSDDRDYIDINLQIELFGCVLFCTPCFREIAAACDYMPIDNHKLIVSQLQMEIVNVKEELERIKLQAKVASDAILAEFDIAGISQHIADNVVRDVQIGLETFLASYEPKSTIAEN